MQYRTTPFFIITILLTSLVFFVQAKEKDEGDYFLQGLDLKNHGDWIQALNVWLKGGQILQRQEKCDPRIGVAFIELVTEHSASTFYKLACNMYDWGFSQVNWDKHGEDIENEIRRLEPLVSRDRFKIWQKLLKNKDAALGTKIRAFWLSKDPTPSTEINERLIEHWQRIVYARKNFKKSRNSVYETDDRGLIYVKFGKPERISSGMLGTNRAQLKQWTDIILSSEENAQSLIVGRSVRPDAVVQTLLLQEIERFNHFPEYEIWFYHSLQPDEPIFFIFGNREGIGLFGLRNGIEDFISTRAFLKSSARNTRGILPGAVLQSLYYSQLSHLNPYFEDRYYELERVWDLLDSGRGGGTEHVNTAFRLKRQQNETRDAFDPVRTFAVREKSDFDKTVSKVDLLVQPFRFLDEKNNPKLAFMTFSFPKIKSRFMNLAANAGPEYSLVHTLMVYNDEKTETERFVDTPTGLENMSTFTVPHLGNQREYAVVSEVFGEFVQSNREEVTKQVIGVGKQTVLASPPLSTSSEHLELSDLLIGIKYPQESGASRNRFPVIPSNKIWETDSLKIYLEVYHLFLDSKGLAHFNIDFEVSKLQGKKKNKEESISLSFNFDSPFRTSKETFEIDISKLLPGNYEFLVKVTDTVSRESKGRTAAFEVQGE